MLPERTPTMKPNRRSAVAPNVVITFAVAAALALGGCENPMKKKDDEEAAKNTTACKLEGERLLLRFDSGEVRLLLPSGDRVFLYQIPSASGVRYTNGSLELRGKGNDLQLSRDGTTMALTECGPYVPPAPPK
jgi:membrane-bound inhibitor of C-type lysozyme